MKSLQDSSKVLVATGGKPTLDKYISAALIARSLKNDKNKTVHVASPTKINSVYTDIIPMGDIKVLNSLPPKKFVLEFRGQKGQVKNIQWNQEGNDVSFFIKMEEGDFNGKNLDMKTTGSDYETIILVGIKSLDELGGIYSNSKEVFQNTNVIAVGGKPQSQEIRISSQIDEKHSSVSEDSYNFLQQNGISIDQAKANSLLAGIFSATGNFKKNISDPKTFIVCADLMKKGATNESAQKIIDRVKSASSKPQSNGSRYANNGSNNGQSKQNTNNTSQQQK